MPNHMRVSCEMIIHQYFELTLAGDTIAVPLQNAGQ